MRYMLSRPTAYPLPSQGEEVVFARGPVPSLTVLVLPHVAAALSSWQGWKEGQMRLGRWRKGSLNNDNLLNWFWSFKVEWEKIKKREDGKCPRYNDSCCSMEETRQGLKITLWKGMGRWRSINKKRTGWHLWCSARPVIERLRIRSWLTAASWREW